MTLITADSAKDIGKISGGEVYSDGTRPVFSSSMILFGLAAILSSLMGFAGRHFNFTLLSSLYPGNSTLAFSGGICYIVLGSILVFFALRPFRKGKRMFVGGLLAVIIIIESVEFTKNIAGDHSAIEKLAIQAGNLVIGQPMSPITPVASGLIITTAAALLLLVFTSEKPEKFRHLMDITGILGMGIVLVGFTFLLSYILGAPLMYGTANLPVSSPGIIAVFFLGFGIITAAGPGSFPLRYLMGSSMSARLLRAFLPLTLVVLFGNELIAVLFSVPGNIPVALMFSASIVIFSVFTTFVVFSVSNGLGVTLETEERKRREAEKALARKNRELVQLNEELTSTQGEMREANERLVRNEQILRVKNEELDRNAMELKTANETLQLFQAELLVSRDELEKSVTQLRVVFDHISPGVLVTDLSGTPHYWNPAAGVLLELAESHVSPADFLKFAGNFILSSLDGQELPEPEWPLARVLRGDVLRNYEVRLTKRGTGWTRVFRYGGRTARDARGKPILAVLTFDDITERKKAEEVRSLLSSIVTYSEDAIYGKTLEGIITSWNAGAEKMYGYTPEEAIGRHVSFLAPKEYSEEIESVLAKIGDGISVDSFETIRVKKNGEQFTGFLRVSPIKNANGDLIGASTIVHDITRLKQMENALVITNKKLNILSSITRHDINNQLTVLQGYLVLYHGECKGEDKAEGYFERLMKSIEFIERQIAFTKSYQDLGVKAPVWQRVWDVISNAKTGFGEIRFTVGTGDREIFADILLEKVFFNLFDNALRHGEHVTEIRVTSYQRDGGCLITVEDDGVGVPMDEKEHIFERGVGKNTGLGLFLVREILAITGITIRETGEPGRGARFEISIPGESCRF